MEVELADSTDKEVIRNLKLHFINEFERTVGLKVIASLKEEGVAEEEARKWAEGTVQVGAIGKPSPYLYCIAFNDEYFRREGYDSEIFESFKEAYIQEFNSRLEKCCLKNSDFYEYKNGMLYIKNVSDKVVMNVTEYVTKEVAFDFRTPGTVESKVENFKNVLSELIYGLTGKCVDGYDYDVFKSAKKIKHGNNFVLIPLVEVDGWLEPLSEKDVKKINEKYGNVFFNIISNVKGKTANPQYTNYEKPVYAFSNKQIAQLLPVIMQSPISYNKELGRFEFAVNLENLRNRQRSFSPNPGSDGEDSPSSSLSGIDSPRQGTPSPLLLRSVKAKKNVLWNFILHFPPEKSEYLREKISPFLSSTDGIEKLYLVLSSFCDRDGLYSELRLSRKQRNKMEETWRSLHQFEESLSASSDGLEGLTLGGPGCRNSVASKDSKDSAYYTGPSTSRRSSFGSVESSDEDDISRNSSRYASSVSRSSTDSSVSSNVSADTIVAGGKRDDTLHAGASCSKRGSTSRVDVSRYNEEHGPTVLYNEGKGIAKKFGIESAFEPDKYGQFCKNWERYGYDRMIKRLNEPSSERQREQQPSTRATAVTILKVRDRHLPPGGPC
ncbi:MAG: hypothetical protein PG978_000651 [Wolbachia endosymbiont of Ctenocephalides felis wCfeF]|nr:MAG: hypothetical protein PG978_000651 [Wolbachia endosymbiont of Ctenocephalides felis wCfeF]